MSTFNAYLLEDNFDPKQLPAGRYATISGTPAFDDAYAAVLHGQVEELGVNYDDEGTAMLVFSTERSRQNGRSVRRNSDDLLTGQLQQVKVKDEDLIKEVRAYGKWKMAWWREAIQNSVDAGATDVRLVAREIADDPDGKWLLSCQDNGSGMTPDILINKFLARFGSTKTGSGATGGFGEAKKLLLFAWTKWRILSQNAKIDGKGELFTPSRSDSYLNGTRIECEQPAAEHTTLAHAIEFVQRCNLPGTRVTYIDDEGRSQRIQQSPKANTSGLKPIRESQSIRIYFVKNKRGEDYKSSSAWVRVYSPALGTSLFMFDKPLSESTDGQVIVEIVGSSVGIFTANRDSFVYGDDLRFVEAFIQELAKDSKSATKPRSLGFTKTYSKGYRERASLPDIDLPYGGDFKDASEGAGQNKLNGQGVKALLDQVAQAAEKAEESGGYGGSFGSEAYKTLSGLGQTADLAESILEDLRFASDVELKRSIQQLKWEPDFIVINEIEGFDYQSVLRSPLKKFYPEEMTPTVARLARVWMELCRWVLMQLRCDEEWGIGFVFSTDTGAAYSRRSGLNWLLLNPFDLSDRRAKTLIEDVSEGRSPKNRLEDLEILRVTDRNDFKWLYAAAIHEATHFADGLDYHDEAFSSALTMNIAKCADGMLFYKKILDATASRRAPRGAAKPKTTKATKPSKATEPAKTDDLLSFVRLAAEQIGDNILNENDPKTWVSHATLDRALYFDEAVKAALAYGAKAIRNSSSWDHAVGSSFRPTVIQDHIIQNLDPSIFASLTESNNAGSSGVALIFENCVFAGLDSESPLVFSELDLRRVEFVNCHFVGVDFDSCAFEVTRRFSADAFSARISGYLGIHENDFEVGPEGLYQAKKWSKNVISAFERKVEYVGTAIRLRHLSTDGGR
jgi:hypothetical protein